MSGSISSSMSTSQELTGRPAKQGLYDPRVRTRCLRRRLRRGHERPQDPQDRQQEPPGAEEPRPPRREPAAEANTGDGAGILIQLPHKFFVAESKKARLTLPAQGQYGAGLVYLPAQPHRPPQTRGSLRRQVIAVRRASCSSDGAASRPTTPCWATRPSPPSRSCARCSSAVARRPPMTPPSSASST